MSEQKAKDTERARKERLKLRKKKRSLKTFSRHFDMEWSVPFFKQAMKELSETMQWPSLEWRLGVVQAWQEASAKEFAGRLLERAKAGQLRVPEFKAIAITRKLNPPGGRQRGN